MPSSLGREGVTFAHPLDLSAPMGDFVRRLRAPAILEVLAQLYGEYLAHLQAVTSREGRTSGKRPATREILTPASIVDYLETWRGTVQHAGRGRSVTLPRLPRRSRAVEGDGWDALRGENPTCAHNWAAKMGGEMYRCRLPGCAGATLNQFRVRRAIPAHCDAYHKSLAINLTFRIE